MASGADDIVGHFRLAYQTVVRFPVLIVPPLAVAVLGFLLVFFIGGRRRRGGRADGRRDGGRSRRDGRRDRGLSSACSCSVS